MLENLYSPGELEQRIIIALLHEYGKGTSNGTFVELKGLAEQEKAEITQALKRKEA